MKTWLPTLTFELRHSLSSPCQSDCAEECLIAVLTSWVCPYSVVSPPREVGIWSPIGGISNYSRWPFVFIFCSPVLKEDDLLWHDTNDIRLLTFHAGWMWLCTSDYNCYSQFHSDSISTTDSSWSQHLDSKSSGDKWRVLLVIEWQLRVEWGGRELMGSQWVSSGHDIHQWVETHESLSTWRFFTYIAVSVVPLCRILLYPARQQWFPKSPVSHQKCTWSFVQIIAHLNVLWTTLYIYLISNCELMQMYFFCFILTKNTLL